VEFESPHLHHQGMVTDQARAPRELDNVDPGTGRGGYYLLRLAAVFAYLKALARPVGWRIPCRTKYRRPRRRHCPGLAGSTSLRFQNSCKPELGAEPVELGLVV
jgi:hypothetical protein